MNTGNGNTAAAPTEAANRFHVERMGDGTVTANCLNRRLSREEALDLAASLVAAAGCPGHEFSGWLDEARHRAGG